MTQATERAGKPVPEPDESMQPFYAAAQQGQLALPRCRACQAYLALGTRVCTECLSEETEWQPVSGKGTLFTFGIMHQLYHPGFRDELPYNIAVVELDEGPRLNTNVVGLPHDQLRVGMRLEVAFEQVSPAVSLPRFRPAR
jgi:hypothetical protein